MGFLGLFNFALTCFDLLAWPVFALGYPLCASIRAVETNSNYHMRKLVIYWILFSLLSLFELAFVKPIECILRIPLWPYIKLGTICWLVLPRFNGADYCYNSLIHLCLSVDLEEVMTMLYKRKKASVGKDNFLSVAERYVTENGTEALEKLISSKGSSAEFGVEKVKAVTETDKREMPQLVKSNGNEFKIDHKDISSMEQPGKNSPVPENSANEKKTVETVEVKEMGKPPNPPTPSEDILPAETPLEKVQTEWTCAVCQVKTSCEANLNSHLSGKKHRTKCEELKSKSTKQPTKPKAGPSNRPSTGVEDNQGVKKQNEKVQVKVKSERGKKNADNNINRGSTNVKSWCPYCTVTCLSETDYLAHLNGKKHLARVQEMSVYAAAVQEVSKSSSASEEEDEEE